MKNLSIYAILIGIMFIWGMNVTAIKTLVQYFPTITIQSARVFTAGLVVFAILAMMKKIRKPTKKEYVYIILGGLLNVTTHHLFLGVGLSKTSGVNGGLILGMGPLLTALMAILFLGTRLTLARTIGFISGGIGITLTVLGGGNGLSGISLGDLAIFLSITAQAASFIIISKAAKTMDPRLLTGYMLIFGSVVLFFIGLIIEPEGLGSLANDSLSLWLVFLGSAVIATAFGHMLYNHAVGVVGPAETSIFLNLNTFFSLIGASIFLGEEITSFHLLGLVFIVIGVLFGSGAIEELLLKRKATRKVA
ncbi:EamA domain-containing membrane protein RarD [Mesobacillus persicus]|uniref:EamA domain-containing membrane protein RarD n=1 Tax=Mesobacillus persicus TaxID=930146 RepID=A0A1H8K1V2_9BACI|nr:DMT family transporter [Mesobacillus persicus]SEN86902.1 EamA domain-containing membrane protein RarD [Mesobacillus persicus]